MTEENNPWRNDSDFFDKDFEWRQNYRFSGDKQDTMMMLCNPEDVRHCEHCEQHGTCCRHCEVPLCKSCKDYLIIARDCTYNIKDKQDEQKTGWILQPLPYCIPMALANDNMWGYAPSIITQHRVRFIEMAAVLPVWTSMIVYYVEGDFGHLLNEEISHHKL